MEEEKVKNEKKDEVFDKICEQVDKKLKALTNEGIQQSNIDYLGKLIDVKKDIADINHKEKEEEIMMYRDGSNYGNYGTYNNYGARQRDSRGRFMEGNNYGRNYGARYRGHDMLDDASMYYGNYMENRENGRYGSPETDKAFDYMVKSATDFIDHIFNEVDSPEQAEMLKMELRKLFEKRM